MEFEFSTRQSQTPPPSPVMNQNSPVCVPPSHLLNMHFNIILPSMPTSSKWSISLRSPYQNPLKTSPVPHTCHMPSPSHYFWFDHPNNIWWMVQIMKLRIQSLLYPPVTWPPGHIYLPQQHIFGKPQTMFPPECEKPVSQQYNKQLISNI